jgi:hypothetical protein
MQNLQSPRCDAILASSCSTNDTEADQKLEADKGTESDARSSSAVDKSSLFSVRKKIHKNKFDTKNLVKNFLNAFVSFVNHPDEEQVIKDVLALENEVQLIDLRNSLKNFFKGQKFNRALLKEFIFEDNFRPL